MKPLQTHLIHDITKKIVVNNKLKYEIIKTVLKWANKKGTIKAGMVDKQKNSIQYLELRLQRIKTM